jgi:hypothetical protein
VLAAYSVDPNGAVCDMKTLHAGILPTLPQILTIALQALIPTLQFPIGTLRPIMVALRNQALDRTMDVEEMMRSRVEIDAHCDAMIDALPECVDLTFGGRQKIEADLMAEDKFASTAML